MANFTNKTKSTPFSASNKAKVVTVIRARPKAGKSWGYGQPGYTYGMLSDPNIGVVYYGKVGIGTEAAITNRTKN